MNFVNNQSQGPSELQFLLPFTECPASLGLVHLLQKTFNRLYKLHESHYEDSNTRHDVCCQTHLLQLFVMSGGASSWKEGDRDIFKEQESHKITFSFFSFLFFFNQRQPDMYLLLECTRDFFEISSKKKQQQGIPVSCAVFCFSSEVARRPGQGRWECTPVSSS